MWPKWFEITPLARLVFQFLPAIQVKRFVCDSKDELQFQICSWMPKIYLTDVQVGEAICRADNLLCLPYFKLGIKKQTKMLKFPMPNLLPKLLETHYGFFNSDDDKVALCNFKVLIEKDVCSIKRRLRTEIQNFGPSRNRDCLLWILQNPSLFAEIGHCFTDPLDPRFHFLNMEQSPLDLDLWTLLFPCVKSRQLTLSKASNYLLSLLPPDVFVVVESGLSVEQRNIIYDLTFKNCNWPLAAYLWNPQRHVLLPIDFPCNTYANICLLEAWRWNYYDTKMVPEVVDDIRRLNSALEFASSDAVIPPNFQHAIRNQLGVADAKLGEMFEYACIHGQFYIVRDIWMQVSDIQKCELRVHLAKSGFCQNADLLAFAWVHAQSEILVKRWIDVACNTNNDVVWRFLHEKDLLAVYFEQTVCPCLTLVHSLGFKSAAMLEVIWDFPGVQTPANIHAITQRAAKVKNTSILQFFNARNTQLCQSNILLLFKTACLDNCTNIIAQLTDASTLSQKSLANIYFHPRIRPETRRVLWSVAPLIDPLPFFTHFPRAPFDFWVLLLEHRVVSNQQLMDACQKHNKKQLNKLWAHIYCDADESRKNPTN